MKVIVSDISNAYFNIAAEEYLLRNFDEDVFMLYINEPSVIVGKHQNAFAELNYWYIQNRQIKVVRRLSGGGSVFHDAGNLNFCFIRTGKEGSLIDFRRFTQPILDVLQQMGVPAEYSGRNDLLVYGKKFSGNAEHVYRNRTLHHGTILFNSQLDRLTESLKVNQSRFLDKGVRSVRSMVTNILEYLNQPLLIAEFRDAVAKGVGEQFHASEYSFSDVDCTQINLLVNEKYSQWEWNWGYSPRFTFEKQEMVDGIVFDVKLEIEKGKIKTAFILADGQKLSVLVDLLMDQSYHHSKLQDIISQSSIGSFSTESILRGLF